MVSFFVSPSLSTILKLRNVWSSENSTTDTNSSTNVSFDGKSSLSFVSTAPINLKEKAIFKNLSPLFGSCHLITSISKKGSSLKPFFSNVAFTNFSCCNVV